MRPLTTEVAPPKTPGIALASPAASAAGTAAAVIPARPLKAPRIPAKRVMVQLSALD